MEEWGDSDACPHCGYQKTPADYSPLYLRPRTILARKYVIGRVLGHGGFGITYLAWNLNLEIKLAIKEFLPTDLVTREPQSSKVAVYTGAKKDVFQYGLERFIEEAKALATFNSHPGIVTVHDYLRENGTAYIVMEYVEGITFKEYIQRQGGKIPYETARNIIMPVLDALREVHSAGMLHRDISPDNIYISKQGHIKLLDFGAARYAVSEHSQSLSVMLKPGYAPEEQYRSKGMQGPWTDIFAAAATLYHAITGVVPPQSLDRLEEDTLVPPSEMGASIPPDAEAALVKALSVKAADRHQTVSEFQEALNAPSPAEPPVIVQRTEQPKNEEEEETEETSIFQSTRARIIAGGIAAVVCIGIFLFFMLQKSPDRKAYEEARKIDSVTAYRAYINVRPAGMYSGVVMFDIGEKYFHGEGVEKNEPAGKEWFERSYTPLKAEAEQGMEEAFWRLGYLYFHGYGVSEDTARAKHWCDRSARAGYADGQFLLGEIYCSGKGVLKDYSQAKYWYEKSAEKRNSDGLCRLGDLYFEGQGVTQDYARAQYWYERSAKLGNAAGQLKLGDLYYFGQGVPQNFARAKHWYEKAAKQGNAIGQLKLGELYIVGEGVPQDNLKAKFWLEKSAAQGNEKAIEHLKT